MSWDVGGFAVPRRLFPLKRNPEPEPKGRNKVDVQPPFIRAPDAKSREPLWAIGKAEAAVMSKKLIEQLETMQGAILAALPQKNI